MSALPLKADICSSRAEHRVGVAHWHRGHGGKSVPRSVMSRGEQLPKMARVSLFRAQANAMGSHADTIVSLCKAYTIVSLCKAYKDWQSEHGLYLGDVPEIPEHLEDGHLTTNEREWLRVFIQRWNAACDRERECAVAA